jgi:hypothetical protein
VSKTWREKTRSFLLKAIVSRYLPQSELNSNQSIDQGNIYSIDKKNVKTSMKSFIGKLKTGTNGKFLVVFPFFNNPTSSICLKILKDGEKDFTNAKFDKITVLFFMTKVPESKRYRTQHFEKTNRELAVCLPSEYLSDIVNCIYNLEPLVDHPHLFPIDNDK